MMRRARGKVAVAAAATAALAAAAGATALAAGTTHTRAVIYHAFTASGAPAIHITHTARGTCNGGSAAINRDDAWRCFAGNVVYDPCFSSPLAKGIVVCPAAAWASSGIEVKPTAKLTAGNHRKPSTSVEPWALQTTSGLKCQLATGATNVINGRRANYFCHASKTVLWGNPSRASQPWTIYAAPGTATKLTTRVKLKLAWF